MNFAERVNQGLEQHRLGRYMEAEAIYKEVLAGDPRQPGAHNLLANLYHDRRDDLHALYHANLAISLDRNAHFLNTRGRIFIAMNRFQEAVSDLRGALKLSPDMAEAHNNLCVAYRHLGDTRRSIEHGRRATSLMPGLADAWVSLGAAQQDGGAPDAALASYEEARRLAPGHALAHANAGKLEYRAARFGDAVASLEKACSLEAGDLEASYVLAHSLIHLGRLAEAATVLETGYAAARNFHALAPLLKQDPFFGVLVQVCRYFAGVINQPSRAVALYEKSLVVSGVEAAICINLGTIYFGLHRLPDAIRYYEKALAIEPNQVWGHNNLGVCHSDQGRSARAIECFQAALAIQPDFSPALGWLLREKTQICDWDDFSDVRRRVSALRDTANTTPISPFVALSVFADPAELHYWARLSANELFSLTANLDPVPRSPRRAQGGKIRLGYYSFDFRNHPVAHLTARLFDLHDRSRFDIHIYSYGPDDGSAIRERIRGAATHFVDVKDLSIVDTARRIAEDDLDILIDLTGNTQHNRSQIMALRPARIQAHWLGFIGTMGSSHYDYILADDFVVPPGAEGDFSEKILRLPGGMHIMDETRVIDAGQQTRAANGLPEAGVVFGCFCQSFKIQPEMFARWMEILREVPGSVLWLASGPAGMAENLGKAARQQGIDPARLIVAPRCPIPEYLTRFSLIDLFLDTFPYTSGTVASDALWAGCPVLTLTGRSMVSRMAGSILHHADMGELVCDSPQAYVGLATRLGQNPDELAGLKRRLARARSTASLFDAKKFVRGLEDAVISVLHSPHE